VAELLLEIGFEEMPAPWLADLGAQLERRFTDAAGREQLEPKRAEVSWSPRRLVLGAELLARQADREEPVWGPSLKVAKDAAGKWTGAAQGFAKKNGVAADALRQGAKDPAKPEELYLLHVKQTKGRPAGEVLPDVIAASLRGLSFPKRMSWDAWLDDGKGAFPFGRPIRWLVALLDGAVVPFVVYELAGGAKGEALARSGSATVGHRFLPRESAGRPQDVKSLADLRDTLKRHFVLVDPAERERKIGVELAALVKGASAPDDHGLRAEWRDLVEFPTVVSGRVPSEFQSLPREVLETVLVHHQKYIPLPDPDGRVARFAAVTNTDGSSSAEIVRGMERVVIARLRDAAFFHADDMKRPLAERAPDLAGVTFHKGLGSYADKVERLGRLVEAMTAAKWLSAEQGRHAAEAARLCKADLTTSMVREFAELQGTVGGLYLQAQGAPRAVADAVRWHYHPVAVEPDAAPAAAFAGRDADARVFAAVALADKLDTLAGYFGLGESPTGSRDPYGLRRAGQGAVRAVLDFWRPQAGEATPDLRTLVASAVAGYPPGKQPKDATTSAVEAFLLDRLEHVLQARGYAADEGAAVLNAPGTPALSDLVEATRRLEALQRVRREVPEDFAGLAEAFKRAKNIVTQAEPAAAVDAKLFEKDAEHALLEATSRLEQAKGSYEERLRGLAALRAPVARFFDDVLVMAENPRVRANRLALLQKTLSLFYRIADISRLGGTS